MALINHWFKIVKDGKLLGVATNQNFARYSEKSGRVNICDVMDGQYLILNDKFYRDDWMLPLDPSSFVEYETATVVSISEKQYDILNKYEPNELIDSEEPQVEGDSADIPEKIPNETETATVEFVRNQKIRQLSAECGQLIENGFSLILSDGASHHFSMSIIDQINLINLEIALNRNEEVVYHADGELAQYYSEEDARSIVTGAKMWSLYNRTLFNSLKNWINNIEDISVIDSISFDSEIPDEYCTAAFQTVTENL